MITFYNNLNKILLIINMSFHIYLLINTNLTILKIFFSIIFLIWLISEFIKKESFIDRFNLKISCAYENRICNKVLFSIISLLTMICRFILNIFISKLICNM